MKTTSFFKGVAKSVAVLALVAGVSASALTEGTDYVVLEKPVTNAEGTVIKVFSYDCPFCYKYDKAVTKPVMEKVPDMKFVPYHLSTKGVFGAQGTEVLATMIVLDEAAGVNLLSDDSKFKKAKFALYKAYHDSKERWGADPSNPANVDAFIKTALDGAGVSKEEFEKAKANPKVAELIAKWGTNQDGTAYAIAKIQGVPAFVVDGKYLIKTNSIKGIDQMAETIKTLHKMK